MINILLIEDNPADARLVRELLLDAAAGSFRVESAGRLSQGLDRLAQNGVDVLLLDLGLPDSQGLDTFLRIHAGAPALPVVVLSGVADEQVAVQAVQAGAQDYLVKGQADGPALARALRYAVERGRAEQALRDSEERFRALVETTSDWVWQVDAEGHYTYSSPKVTDLLGYTPRQVLGRTPAQLAAGSDTQRVAAHWRGLLASHRPFAGFESTAAHRQGKRIVLESSGVPIFAERSRLAGYRGIDRDITRRKRAEQTCAYLASLVDSSDDAICGLDLNGAVVSWNAAAERLYGYSAAEAVGRPLALLAPPDRSEELPDLLAKIRAGERIDTRETIRVRRDGRAIHVALTASPIQDAHGRTVGASAIARDITGRKRAERALSESERRYRLLFDAGNDAVCVYGIAPDAKPDRFSQVNRVMCERLGYSPEELLNLSPQDIRAPRVPGELAAMMARLRADGAVLFEAEHIAKGGRRIPVEINARLIELDGRPAVLSIARDISERKRAEAEIRGINAQLERRVEARTAELAAANRELEAFTYSVSHDLHAPVRHIASFAALLRGEVAPHPGSAAARYLERIESGAREMRCIIDALLSLSRVGRRDLNRKPADLNALIESARRDLLPDCEGRNIVWRVSDLPSLDCDRGLLKQAFVNLLSNAIKFTRPRDPAVIEVGAVRPAGETVLFVRDNGVGFDMRAAGRLFGVLERLHPAAQFEGTGIGLATVERIVRRHGGRIWADAAVNQGATFYFTLAPAPASE